MKTQRDELKRQLSLPAPAADPNRPVHPNCGIQLTMHHRNTKAKDQRIEKKTLAPDRIRKITSSFAFIEHRFLRQGFWSSLSHHELLLYLKPSILSFRSALDVKYVLPELRILADSYLYILPPPLGFGPRPRTKKLKKSHFQHKTGTDPPS